MKLVLFASLKLVVAHVSGGVGIANMVEKMENQEYMGFENFCHQS